MCSTPQVILNLQTAPCAHAPPPSTTEPTLAVQTSPHTHHSSHLASTSSTFHMHPNLRCFSLPNNHCRSRAPCVPRPKLSSTSKLCLVPMLHHLQPRALLLPATTTSICVIAEAPTALAPVLAHKRKAPMPSTLAIPSPPQATPPNPSKTLLRTTSIANESRSKH